MTRLLNLQSHPAAIDEALAALQSGGLVVFPTDTVYGVGAAVDQAAAVARLYIAKGRPEERAIPVLVSGLDAAYRVTSMLNSAAERLIHQFWPGPLTIVLPAAEWLPGEIIRDTGCVGIRMPDHSIALELIRRSGGAVAVTSANRSGEPETRTAEDAAFALADRVDVVVDGGLAPGGVPSTVVKLSENGKWEILRTGAIAQDQIQVVLDTPER